MQTKTANRSAGRPRRHGVEETVLAAAVALAGDEGYAGATVDAVAARAGVAKTTVYRRWPSKEALAVDALAAALDLPPCLIDGEVVALDDDGNPDFSTLQNALKRAGLNPSDIDYVNAHGTSTPMGDEIELGAVKRLFGCAHGSSAFSAARAWSCMGSSACWACASGRTTTWTSPTRSTSLPPRSR